MSWSASLLELLHPDGRAERALLLGGGVPPSLVPARHAESAGPRDLIVIAPSRSELTNANWLAQAVQVVADRLADDGVGYFLLPRRSRGRAIRLLARHGLVPEVWFAHFPDFSTTRHMVPVLPMQATYALSSLIPVRHSRRRLALALLARGRGTRLLTHTLPAAGIVARRPGARPLSEWLFTIDESPGRGAAPIITSGRGGDAPRFVLHSFATGIPTPNCVVKIRGDATPADAARQLSSS